jgi:hypothetical protein
MARYPLNLPQQLKKEAEEWAARQGCHSTSGEVERDSPCFPIDNGKSP